MMRVMRMNVENEILAGSDTPTMPVDPGKGDTGGGTSPGEAESKGNAWSGAESWE